MKTSKIILLFVFLTSCSIKIYLPKGNYPEPPIIFHSDKTKEKVWDNIVDLFAQKGIPIKIIDHSSGLIISEPIALKWSYENKYQKLIRPDAQVVIFYRTANAQEVLRPERVTGEWNVRIKEDSGRTSVNVNLFNLTHEEYNSITYHEGYRTIPYREGECKTTGAFEKDIFDIIK